MLMNLFILLCIVLINSERTYKEVYDCIENNADQCETEFSECFQDEECLQSFNELFSICTLPDDIETPYDALCQKEAFRLRKGKHLIEATNCLNKICEIVPLKDVNDMTEDQQNESDKIKEQKEAFDEQVELRRQEFLQTMGNCIMQQTLADGSCYEQQLSCDESCLEALDAVAECSNTPISEFPQCYQNKLNDIKNENGLRLAKCLVDKCVNQKKTEKSEQTVKDDL